MRFSILATVLLTSVAGAATPAAAPPSPAIAAAPIPLPSGRTCRDPFRAIPAETLRVPGAQRLGELPPGDTLLAVVQEVDGCIDPVIVRYGDGRPAPAAAPAPGRPQARLYR